jgi:hypothetical protein
MKIQTRIAVRSRERKRQSGRRRQRKTNVAAIHLAIKSLVNLAIAEII